MSERGRTLHLATSYLPARILPGLINVFALALYTRLLDPAAMGRYGIVLAVVNLVQASLFRWLRVALLRFYEGAENEHEVPALFSTIFTSYLATAAIVTILWLAGAALWPMEAELRASLFLGLPLVLAQAAFELVLALQISTMQPLRYGLYALGRATLALAMALLFIAGFGLHERGVILGMALGSITPVLFDFSSWGRQIRISAAGSDRARQLLAYGAPLTIAMALSLLIPTSDRLMLNSTLDPASVGQYTAASDLAYQTLTLILVVINMAAYPLAVQAFEQSDADLLSRQLEENLLILLAAGLPTAVGFTMLSKPAAGVFFGEQFQLAATFLIPWIGWAAFTAGLRAYYFDLSFQLSLKTRLQVFPLFIAVGANLLLNLWWISRFGFIGAAAATVVAFTLALMASAILGRVVLPLPMPWIDIMKIILCVGIMVAMIHFLPDTGPTSTLILKTTIGGGAYALAIYLFGPASIRTSMVQLLQRL